MKFVGVEEQFLAVATSVEQVRVYDLGSMSCSYVLAGHTDNVLCLDTCTTSSGRTLIVTGSKDNTVSSLFLYVFCVNCYFCSFLCRC
ncbi:putative transcription factor WD40-like family [Helianthus annuus]|nr:putative transcription factor WD40-like family [Helianthus annuus]KAJ0781977.1 putative transcription factor WD40-like family [Helianthus annuus]